ncbi:MAG: lysozyme inhibitor LprI family protein [Methylocella sp.]
MHIRFEFAAAFIAGALATFPAVALDCAAAKTAEEKAICADPAASAADEAMTKAYNALALSFSPTEKATLVTSQRRWLKRRGYICGSREGDGAIASCIAKEAQERRAFLQGEPQSGPGTGQRLVPVLVQHVGKPNEYDIDVNAVKFADPNLPGEKLFNAKVDDLLKEVPASKQSDIQRNMVYSYQLDVTAPFVSPKFASAHVELYDFSGGAHGNSSTSNFAIDMETGKELHFSDLFEPGAQEKFVASCLDQIKQQKHEKIPDAPFDVISAEDQKKKIENSVSDLTRWTISANAAEVTFDPYALGAYVEGSYQCDFPAEMLRPLLKFDYLPGAPEAGPASPAAK